MDDIDCSFFEKYSEWMNLENIDNGIIHFSETLSLVPEWHPVMGVINNCRKSVGKKPLAKKDQRNTPGYYTENRKDVGCILRQLKREIVRGNGSQKNIWKVSKELECRDETVRVKGSKKHNWKVSKELGHEDETEDEEISDFSCVVCMKNKRRCYGVICHCFALCFECAIECNNVCPICRSKTEFEYVNIS